jgi:hypothetical protein
MVKTTILRERKMKDIFYLDVEQHTSSITPLSMFIDLSSSSSEKDLPSLVQNLGA